MGTSPADRILPPRTGTFGLGCWAPPGSGKVSPTGEMGCPRQRRRLQPLRPPLPGAHSAVPGRGRTGELAEEPSGALGGAPRPAAHPGPASC